MHQHGVGFDTQRIAVDLFSDRAFRQLCLHTNNTVQRTQSLGIFLERR
jgi:hypothetical protein